MIYFLKGGNYTPPTNNGNVKANKFVTVIYAILAICKDDNMRTNLDSFIDPFRGLVPS